MKKKLSKSQMNGLVFRVEDRLGRQNFFSGLSESIKNECNKCGPTDNFGYWLDGAGICDPCFRAECRRAASPVELEEIKYHD